jgi:hypothetical protein
MPVSMLVRCEKCGYENFPQHRFCGMCAAELRLPGPGGSQPVPPPARISASPGSPRPVSRTSTPAPTEKKEEAIAQKVSGPSFLGLGNEPDTGSVSYLLEEDEPTHRGRNLILIVLMLGIAAAAWHWRQDLRAIASRLLSSPPPVGSANGNGTPDANSAGPASSTTETASINSASADNKSQQPAAAPPQPGDQTPPPAQVPPTSTGSSATDSTTGQAQADQTHAEQNGADQTEPSNPPQASNAAASTATANPDDSQETPSRAPSRGKSAKQQAQTTVEDLEAEGEKYLYGNGAPENCTRARTSLLAAAQRSSAQAQSVLGTMYATGHCATRDLPTAYRWFSRSLRKDSSNTRIEQDLKVLWNQMTPEERQVALRDQR